LIHARQSASSGGLAGRRQLRAVYHLQAGFVETFVETHFATGHQPLRQQLTALQNLEHDAPRRGFRDLQRAGVNHHKHHSTLGICTDPMPVNENLTALRPFRTLNLVQRLAQQRRGAETLSLSG
jgi:hypothetical protein